jgi:alpha-1,6-mannosyltransferase
MKIVDVCEFYAPQGGGVRTYIHAKLAIGARLGHEVTVIAPGLQDEVIEHPGGGKIIFAKSPSLPFDKKYGMFWDAAPVHAILDAERPDVLEASSPWRGAWIARSWQGEALRTMFMHHDPLSAWAYRWFDGVASRETVDRQFEWFWRYLRRMCSGFSFIVCASPSLQRRLTQGGIAGAINLPMGVDAGVFSPAHRNMSVRAELLARCNLPDNATLLLGIGRHTPEKRWPIVIDAVARVAAQRPVGFVLIGNGHQQALVIDHVSGNPHIQLLEPIRDRALLATIMASCDALVHGSAAETFGLVASEALASGLPLVLPDAGAVADIADPAFSETYTTGNARAAAEAIERLLDRDQHSLRSCTNRAAINARTLDDHFTELFDTYAGALAAHRRAA